MSILKVMLAKFLMCKADVQVGGFASGWKGVGMVHNCPFKMTAPL